jgi:hypothetical protein
LVLVVQEVAVYPVPRLVVAILYLALLLLVAVVAVVISRLTRLLVDLAVVAVQGTPSELGVLELAVKALQVSQVVLVKSLAVAVVNPAMLQIKMALTVSNLPLLVLLFTTLAVAVVELTAVLVETLL